MGKKSRRTNSRDKSVSYTQPAWFDKAQTVFPGDQFGGVTAACANRESCISALPKDDEYYFYLVTFEVESCLFRVPRFGLEEQSQIFRDMFAVPTVDAEGSSEINPIRLRGIKKNAFQDLLRILYPRSLVNSSLDNWTNNRWREVLHLAHMWQFDALRNFVIGKLESLDPDLIFKAELVHRYDIEEWRVPVYMGLVKRASPLNLEEFRRLSPAVAVVIARVREAFAKHKETEFWNEKTQRKRCIICRERRDGGVIHDEDWLNTTVREALLDDGTSSDRSPDSLSVKTVETGSEEDTDGYIQS